MTVHATLALELNLHLKNYLLSQNAHVGVIGNIFYNHGRCRNNLDLMIPDPAYQHKRDRLASIVMRYPNPRVLEIGVNAGHSALIFLSANSSCEFYGVDNCKAYFDGVYNIRSDLYVFEAIKFLNTYFGYPDRAFLFVGDSLTALNDMAMSGRYDHAFSILHLDAQKDRYYLDFIAARGMLAPDSTIVVDDTDTVQSAAYQTVVRLLDEGLVKLDDEFPDIKASAILRLT